MWREGWVDTYRKVLRATTLPSVHLLPTLQPVLSQPLPYLPDPSTTHLTIPYLRITSLQVARMELYWGKSSQSHLR